MFHLNWKILECAFHPKNSQNSFGIKDFSFDSKWFVYRGINSYGSITVHPSTDHFKVSGKRHSGHTDINTVPTTGLFQDWTSVVACSAPDYQNMHHLSDSDHFLFFSFTPPFTLLSPEWLCTFKNYHPNGEKLNISSKFKSVSCIFLRFHFTLK